MTTTTTETELFKGTRRSVHHITGINTDGTAETDVQKVDISTLTGPDGVNAPSAVTVEKIVWSIQGFDAVNLAWDHTTNETIVHLGGSSGNTSGDLDWRSVGGKHDSNSGSTGDILLSTLGATANDSYDITLYLKHEK